MPDTATKLSANHIKSILDDHIGSLERTRHWSRRFLYTPGIHDLAEFAGAYWLLDLIASHCRHPKLIAEEFVVWKLVVHPDRGATLTADDGNETTLFTAHIHRTDFPLDEITLYLTDGVLLLPGEY